ncbi:MAG: phage holin family protein [Firmicutes bacterium]|jgi:hypothetical protein|nr:phage holin family protein [Bacillota bacterium]
METNIEILKFIQPEILILIPVLSILGLMIKKNPIINDWAIPIILLLLGIVFSILILALKSGFTPDVILNGFLQGILVTGMSVYVHQLKIQSTRKR